MQMKNGLPYDSILTNVSTSYKELHEFRMSVMYARQAAKYVHTYYILM